MICCGCSFYRKVYDLCARHMNIPDEPAVDGGISPSAQPFVQVKFKDECDLFDSVVHFVRSFFLLTYV
jgi:hypothetical protein